MYYIGSLLVDVLSSIMLKQEFFKKKHRAFDCS